MRAVASCVRKDQIPEAYKHMPILGRGMTSLVLDRGDNHVVMLCRDSVKVDWLRDERIGAVLGEHRTYGHHMTGMDEFTVYAVDVPRLRRLSLSNRRLVQAAMAEFEGVRHSSPVWSSSMQAKEREFRALEEFYCNRDGDLLHPLITHLSNYDRSQFEFDLGLRNFMENDAGEVVIVDPVFSTELMALVRDYKQLQADRQADRVEFGQRPF